ncbi:lasso peptide biosynthesis B2 protein [Rhizorhabdus sp. FW153]
MGYARFADRTIILDITVDRYWQLDARAGHLLDRIQRGEPCSDAEDSMLMRLRRLGLVQPIAERQSSPCLGAPAEPRRSLIEQRPVEFQHLGLALLVEIACDAIAVRIALRSGRLSHTIASVRKPKRRSTGPLSLDQAADLFERGMRWLPIKRICLADSLALLRFCARRGFAPSLIFAVEAYPFQAHCWVQQDDLVLNDVLADIMRFHPVLVL